MKNKSKPWKIHSTKEILHTPIFKVHVDNSECPRTGRRGNFYKFKFGNWVNIVAVTGKNEIVMIRQFRHGNRKWELEIPGGLIDSTDPDPAFAGQRELLEETGYSGGNARIIGSVCPNPALQDNICYTVFVDNAVKASESAMDDFEDIETILVPVQKVSRLIKDQKIRHGLVLNALHFYLN
jgi:8-oxo-dGTP pyrophosphatase MutT (NUDIX family)